MFYSHKLKKLKKVKHCFFSRKKGFSKGVYKGLNCGKGSKDDKKNIHKNLKFVAKKMGVKKTNLILMNQTHSNKVVEIKKYNYKKKNRCRCDDNSNERFSYWCINSRLCAYYYF